MAGRFSPWTCVYMLAVMMPTLSALEFVWSQESSDYAIREAGGRVKIFKNFTEKATVKIEYAIEGMHGGALIGTLHVLAVSALCLMCCIG